MEKTLTNSLFRFVTFRAPEKVTREYKLKYIQHIDLSDSDIYTEILSGKTLVEAVADFTPLTTEQLISINEPLYRFSEWLAKNNTTITAEKLETYTSYFSLVPFSEAQLLQLWENLFYQIGKQASIADKDIIMELLLAHHFVKNKSWEAVLTDAQLLELATTRILIPSDLFELHSGTVNPEVPVTAFKGSPAHKEALDLIMAKDNADRLSKAIEELKAAKEEYSIKENDHLASETKIHNAAVKAFIAARMEDWSPAPEYAHTLPYTQDELPVFDYTPLPEMDNESLEEILSPESLFLVQSLSDGDASSYERALSKISAQTKAAMGTVFEKGNFTTPVVITGGTELPVVESVQSKDRYGVTIQAYQVSNGKYKIAMVANTGSAGQIISNEIKINDTVYNNVPVETINLGERIGIQLFPQGVDLETEASSFNLKFAFTLDNGFTSDFETDMPLSGTGPVIGNLDDDVWLTDGKGIPDPVSSKYGIRKLGIADYRRVDQTVCCYVPGEVSHIENVMAKEYKEKSTRQLRRSEDTTTSEKQTERENLTDTTSTERYEMQKEAENLLNENKSLALTAGVNAGYQSGTGSKGTSYRLDVTAGANYASNTSKGQSLRQATDFAKEVTVRASEKVLQKVREERITKIIEEYEETNTHGYDNRGDNAEHISGIYRWVDRVYKNQIINYGKRTMYEFLIPHPAAFHKQAMTTLVDNSVTLKYPLNPATTAYAIKHPKEVTRDNYVHWVALYGADVVAPPAETITVGKSFTGSANGTSQTPTEIINDKENFILPDGYYTVSARASLAGLHDVNNNINTPHPVSISIGNTLFLDTSSMYNNGAVSFVTGPQSGMATNVLDRFEGEIPISFYSANFHTLTVNVSIKMNLTAAAYEKWQVETFNAIMAAYNKKVQEYNEAYEKLKAKQLSGLETNPLFYRQIEGTVLKKNCISYLVGQSYMGAKSFLSDAGKQSVHAVPTTEMEQYASVARFMEQAFEWEIMSYSFYPFYWGDKTQWNKAYVYENDDPLFRAFMQAGMARVIATIRPGFEDAVLFYLNTGKVWNGGQVPVIDDDLYVGIVEEMKPFEEKAEGDPWETKVPTSLTVIQNSTVGLDAEGLPCRPECADESMFSFSSDLKLTRLRKEEE